MPRTPMKPAELVKRILASQRKTTKTKPPKYQTLNAWMEGKRVNGQRLLEMLKAERGVTITAGHLSNLLKGSRRMTLPLAWELHELTGVPIEALLEWPVKDTHNSRSAA